MVSQKVIIKDLGNTPAAVNRRTGVLYLSPKFFSLAKEQKVFVLLHELGHLYLNTSNELEADAFAQHWYTRLGYPLSGAVLALTRILSNAPAHVLRTWEIIKRTLDFDRTINDHALKTYTMQERIENIKAHHEEARAMLIEAMRLGQYDEARQLAMELAIHRPPHLQDDFLAEMEQLIQEHEKAQMDNYIEGVNKSDIHHCNCQDEFSGEEDEDDEDDEDEFLGLGKAARERKKIRTESRADARKTRAEATKIKAQAKLKLAEQGIKDNTVADAIGGVVEKVSGLAKNVGGAVGAIKGLPPQTATTTETTTEDTPADAPTAEAKSKWLWIGLGGAGLIVLGLVAYFLFMRKKAA